MKDPIKLTDEELKSALDVHNGSQSIVFQFGGLYMEKMQIENAIKIVSDKETELQKQLKDLQDRENTLVQDMFKKYGDGSLDLERGLFIPKS